MSLIFCVASVNLVLLVLGANAANELDVRLVIQGVVTSGFEGRVEVYSDVAPGPPEWARVCDDRWNTDVAMIVCRQLGFDGVVEIFTRSDPRYGTGTGSFVKIDGCKDIGAAGLIEAGCRVKDGGKKCKNERDAGVKCSPAIVADPVVSTDIIMSMGSTQSTPLSHPMTTTPPPYLTSTAGAWTTTSLTPFSSEVTVSTTIGESVSKTQILVQEAKPIHIAAAWGGGIAALVVLVLVLVVMAVLLRKRCKRKSVNTQSARQTSSPPPEEDHTYQGAPAMPAAVGASVKSQQKLINDDSYQYSAAGLLEESFPYSSVGPVLATGPGNPRIPSQMSEDDYQYTDITAVHTTADRPRIPRQDSDTEEYQYGAGPAEELTTSQSSRLDGICTDEGFYIIPDTSTHNPYQELNVKNTPFAGLQKLKKKPARNNSTQATSPGTRTNLDKLPPPTLQKPARKSPAKSADDGANTKALDGRGEKDEVVEENAYEVSLLQQVSADNARRGINKPAPRISSHPARNYNEHKIKRGKEVSIYMNDITSQNEPVESIDGSPYANFSPSTVGDNPYQNTQFGEVVVGEGDEDNVYQDIDRKTTLPV